MKLFLAKVWRFLRLPKKIQLYIMRVMQDQFLIGVTGIFFNEENKVLMLKHTYRQVQWSLPGGYIKAGEHPEEGIAREIEEECGLVVTVDEQMGIRTDRETARLDIVVVGTFIGGDFIPSHEVTEYGLYGIDELPLMSTRQLLLINKALKRRKTVILPKKQEEIKIEKKRGLMHKLREFFNKPPEEELDNDG